MRNYFRNFLKFLRELFYKSFRIISRKKSKYKNRKMVFGFFTWWPSKGYTLSYRVIFTWFSFHGYFSYSFWYLVASQGYFSYSFWDGFSCDSSKQLTGSFYLVVPSKVKVNIKKQLKCKNKQLKYSREINIEKLFQKLFKIFERIIL